MSEKQINDLPEEILLQVFKKMDFRTVMDSTLVCRKWNEMIGDNSTIFKKVKLHFESYRGTQNIEKLFQMLPEELTRNYQSVKITNWNKSSKKIWELLEPQASHLQSFEMGLDCQIKEEDTENYKKFFASLKKLETLRIANNNLNIDLSHLNRMKSLEVFLHRADLLKYPETAQLTSFKFFFVHGQQSFWRHIDYLASQRSLEQLKIDKCSLSEALDSGKLDAIQFLLKKLIIARSGKYYDSKQSCLRFMNKFANCLEELDIESSFPESVYVMIFNEFRKLNTLKVNIEASFFKDESFYFNIRPNLSVQKLIVETCNDSDLIPIKGLFKILPNLETLDIRSMKLSKELMMLIASNLKKLKHIHVQKIGQSFEAVNIPSLKKFIVFRQCDHKKPLDWKEIVRVLPQLEELEFRVSEYEDLTATNEENIKIIREGCPKLKVWVSIIRPTVFGLHFKI